MTGRANGTMLSSIADSVNQRIQVPTQNPAPIASKGSVYNAHASHP